MPRAWKTVRVFISSTFHDMHAERDHLVRSVFPELKKLCREKRVHLIDLDLRWGVSEQDALGGGALDICLDKIDSCRPYFLGLLGHRYGSVPADKDYSITAAEIYHGVLHNDLPDQVVDLRGIIEGRLEGKRLPHEQVNCLLRWYPYDPIKRKYLLRPDIPPEDAAIIREVFRSYAAYQQDRSFFFLRSERLSHELAGDKPEDFFESDPAWQGKLEALKQQIKDQGLWWAGYDRIEPQDDQDLEAFGRQVKEVLWERIQAELAELPPEAEPDWLEEERELHAIFAADRTRRFVGRRSYLEQLRRFCETPGENRLLMVAGEPGSGKSALLARFSDEMERAHPDCLIIPHFVGASPDSSNLRRSLRRLIAEINQRLGSDEEIPEDTNSLIMLLPQKLEQAAQAGPVLIILDAVNQMERSDDSQAMRWLPARLPANLCLVISTLAGEARDALQARQPQVMEVGGLEPQEIEALVDEYLDQEEKKFPNAQARQAFLAKVSQGSPLYIMVALEELRVFGHIDQLAGRIAELPESVAALFDQVLARVEGDFARFPGLVQEALCLIACGRQGMAPEELQALLASHAPPLLDGSRPDRLPDMLWTRLRLSLDAYLFERSGVVDFFHGQLKQAVGARYLGLEAERKRWHQVIAEYFEPRWSEPYVRALDELPHQLIKAEDWDGVERVLCDLLFIEAKCAAGMTYDLIADYNATLEALPENQENVRIEKARQERIEKYTQDLIAVARGDLSIDDLEIIPSVKPWSEERIEATCQQIINHPTRLDRLRAFAQFLGNESPHLSMFGTELGFCLTQAYNHADSGPVVQAAKEVICTQKLHGLLLCRADQRPPFNPHQACLRILNGPIGTVALTLDGHQAVSGNEENLLRVWDIDTGRCLRTMKEHIGMVEAVAITPDGRLALSGSIDNSMRLWDLETDHVLKTMVHTGWVLAVAMTPDGRLAVSGSDDTRVRVWDLGTGNCLRTLQGHTSLVDAVALTLDGRRAVSGGSDESLRVWDLEAGNCLQIMQGHTDSVRSIALTADGRRAVSGSWDKSLRVWDLETGRCLRILDEHTGKVDAVAITPDGSRAVSGSSDKSLRVWDLGTGRCLTTSQNNLASIYDLTLSPDFRKAVSRTKSGSVLVWDLETCRCLRSLEGHFDSILALAITSDGHRVVSGSWDGTLRVWDMNTGQCLRTLKGYTDWLKPMAITPDGRLAVSCGVDNVLRVVDLATGRCLRTLQGPNKTIHALAWTPDGRRAASSFFHESTRVWDLETGRCLITLPGYDVTLHGLALTPDGRRMVSGHRDDKLRMWDLETGRCLRTVQWRANPAHMFRLTPDGRRAIWDMGYEIIWVWDLQTGHCQKILGQTGWVTAMAFTQDGRHMITIGDDTCLRLWDLETGRCLAVAAFSAPLTSCAVRGNTVVAGGVDGRLRMLRLDG